ncbi:hypothetical protein BDF14DRAFT_314739 [Spinellus fusiger]|nr:hypothetical protein BDF14DRAFT_314739 [Spinellus fusiger]
MNMNMNTMYLEAACIKTRRLGTRGQSKYHYCNIRLRSSYQSPSGTLALARPFASEEVPKTTEDNTCQLVPASDNLTYDILEDTSSGHSNLTGLEGASLLVIATDFPAEANIPSTHPTIPNYSTSPSTNLVLPSLKQISSEVQSKASYNRVRSVGQYDLPTFITPPLRYSHPYEQAELGVSFTTVYEQHCRELLSLIVREQFVHVSSVSRQELNKYLFLFDTRDNNKISYNLR